MALSLAKERFCLLMVQGATQKEAIEKVGKTAQTATQWMKDPEVQARLEELRSDTVSTAQDVLRSSVLRNIDIINRIAQFGGEPGIVPSQLKAAMWAVDKVLKSPSGESMNPALRELAADLERSPDEELEELATRGR